ncbi:hypothetical protein [uncultured Thiodictyon sp.]|jgi:hypothetical protein|uniref:hypothetical protein n=1 Tax=uncultured Thiodictyon sp. TaxID=1846217 RepID=UPI0025E08577|nr:hypothetical protein [uncultured Thiodictyon sp.]
MSKKQAKCNVTVTDNLDNPVNGAHICLISPNGTYRSAISSEAGSAEIVIADRQAVTIFAAHPSFPAVFLPDKAPSDELRFSFSCGENQGSVIAENGSATIPGLDGRLSPIKDAVGRTYIYGDNLSFDNQPDQPFHFRLCEPFDVEDSLRYRLKLIVISIIGRCSLIEYQLDKSSLSGPDHASGPTGVGSCNPALMIPSGKV